MTPLPGIALVGKQGAGKTSIAAALEERGFTPFSWATPAKTLASWAYGPINKARAYEVSRAGLPSVLTGREILQRITTEAIRDNVDEDFWVRIGINALDQYPEHGPWVNDDTRLPNEAEALARRGFVIVKVAAPIELREQRLKDRDGAWNASMEQHRTDNDDLIASHFTIWNTGPLAVVVDTLVGTITETLEAGGRFTNKAA